MTKPKTLATTLALIAGTLLHADDVSKTPALTLGPIVPVSPAGTGVHTPLFRASSEPEGSVLMVCGERVSGLRNTSETFVYASYDGGRSWRETLVDRSTTWSSEPSCALGDDHRAYFATGVSNTDTDRPRHPYGRLYLYSSADEGRTWGKPTVNPFMDWTVMAVDRTQGQNRGRLYIESHDISDGRGEWMAGIPALLVSSEGGRTLQGPFFPPPPATYFRPTAFPRESVVLDDGTLLTILYGSREEGQGFLRSDNRGSNKNHKGFVELIRSSDGGHTLQEPAILGDSPRWLGGSMVLDRKRGLLYAAWLGGETDRPNVMLARSADGGRTWTSNVAIEADDGRRSVASGDLSIAVDLEGRVGLEWPGGNTVCTRFAISVDQGRTFEKPVDLNSCEQNVALKPESYAASLWANPFSEPTAGTPGITILLPFSSLRNGAATLLVDQSGQFHPVWADSHDGKEQVLTRTITVGEPRTPSFEVERLKDVSQLVYAHITGNHYLPESSTFYADVSLSNKGTEPLCAPLYMVAHGLHSDSGAVEIDNADNGVRGDGALWDMTNALEGGVLRAWSVSAPRTLAFQVKDLVGHMNGTPVKADFRVFANTGAACASSH